MGNAITDASADNTHQNELEFSTLDQMLQDLNNIPGSTNEVQDDSSRQLIESLRKFWKTEYYLGRISFLSHKHLSSLLV